MKKAKETFLLKLKKDKIKKNIIDTFAAVDQERFFDPFFKKKFYTEEVIPIGKGENGDPPFVLAKMLQYAAIGKKSRVLEIGTGTGYSTSLISHLADEVFTIDCEEEFAVSAKERLKKLKIGNVRFFCGDGTAIQQPLMPFDVIMIFAACYYRPLNLLKILKRDGVMVFPMGPLQNQQVTVFKNEMNMEDDRVFQMTFHEFCSYRLIRGRYGEDVIPFIGQEDPLKE